jgi:arabinan endo-1,5-alpha-L-arabinosidase
MDRLTLATPAGAPVGFEIAIEGAAAHADRRVLIIDGRTYALASTRHAAWLDLYEALASDLGIAPPLARQRPRLPPSHPALAPLLTEAVDPRILYGYGDPSVARVENPDGRHSWRLLVTSNDAPDAFPILRSDDLKHWTLSGFVFPAGRAPPWALLGENQADFWAPELHRVGEEWWVVFTARAWDHSLAIGLARGASPDGPFLADDTPLLGGGVIDSHLVSGPDGVPHLVWKVDSNDLWPRLLADRLHRQPGLVTELFPQADHQKAATLALTLWPWSRTLEPMEQFCVNQPLIEAATADFDGLRRRLSSNDRLADPILESMRTRIYAQPLSPDGRSLVGDPVVLLENDLPWEAHLIEGPWIVPNDDAAYAFYAGNDFSTPDYGIGVARACRPLGPYAKRAEPLLRSSAEWWGPGHPSVAAGPDGRPHLFLHAFRPGEAGYKAFRALLHARLSFGPGDVTLVS